MMLLLCTECRDANYQTGNRKFDTAVQRGSMHLSVTFTLCADCVQANFDSTDAYLNLGHRKRALNEPTTSNGVGGGAKKWKQNF